MLRVGLTGGLASGKSFVGETLRELGCYLIRADDLGHQVLAPDGETYAAVVKEFGREILRVDGTIDRRRLASIVFKDGAELAKLNALVHPAVQARGAHLLDEYAASHPRGIAVYEAAILIETGSYRDFAKLIVAVCGIEQQIERAMGRDGISREEALDRLKRQMPLDEKVDTSGTKETTRAQVHALYQTLKGLTL
jgi:dephospho-CoA kinase